MAVPVHVERKGTTTDDTSIPSSTNTPVSGAAYVVFVTSRITSGAPAAPTLSGTGGWSVTWTQRQTQQEKNSPDEVRITVFDGVASSGTDGVITADWGAVTQQNMCIDIIRLPDADTSAIQGQTPAGSEGDSAEEPNGTLAAFGNANNTAIFSMAQRSNTTITPDTGWTELGTRYAAGGQALTCTSIYQETDTDLTPSAVSGGFWCAIACEIELAAAAAAYLPLDQAHTPQHQSLMAS